MGGKVLFLLLTFFSDGDWTTEPLTCPPPAQECVAKVVAYGAAHSPELFRVRVFDKEPMRGKISTQGKNGEDGKPGPMIFPPIADYWLQ